MILGNSFFENYYVIWDFDAMSLGFNGYFEVLKPDPPLPPTPPTPPNNKKFPGWAIALLVIVGLVALGVISWLLYKRYQEKRLREDFLTSNEQFDYEKKNRLNHSDVNSTVA